MCALRPRGRGRRRAVLIIALASAGRLLLWQPGSAARLAATCRHAAGALSGGAIARHLACPCMLMAAWPVRVAHAASKASVNLATSDGQTALHYAAAADQDDACKILLAADSDRYAPPRLPCACFWGAVGGRARATSAVPFRHQRRVTLYFVQAGRQAGETSDSHTSALWASRAGTCRTTTGASPWIWPRAPPSRRCSGQPRAAQPELNPTAIHYFDRTTALADPKFFTALYHASHPALYLARCASRRDASSLHMLRHCRGFVSQ